MLNKKILKNLIIVVQLVSSIIMFLLLFNIINKSFFIYNQSLKIMLSFILFSPELFVLVLVYYYSFSKKLNDSYFLLVSTKTFQIGLIMIYEIFSVFTPKINIQNYLFENLFIQTLWYIVIYALLNLIIISLMQNKEKAE